MMAFHLDWEWEDGIPKETCLRRQSSVRKKESDDESKQNDLILILYMMILWVINYHGDDSHKVFFTWECRGWVNVLAFERFTSKLYIRSSAPSEFVIDFLSHLKRPEQLQFFCPSASIFFIDTVSKLNSELWYPLSSTLDIEVGAFIKFQCTSRNYQGKFLVSSLRTPGKLACSTPKIARANECMNDEFWLAAYQIRCYVNILDDRVLYQTKVLNLI